MVRGMSATWMIFAGIWATIVYFPVAAWVWGGGWIMQLGDTLGFDGVSVIDYAGGTAVHINAGTAGLVLAIILGKRLGWPRLPMRPHNLPFVVLGGSDVLGYLPGYLAEERYDDGSRFALIAALVPGAASAWVALAVLLVAAGLAWWRADPDRPWHAQTMLVGVVLLVVNPLYAWYALTLVPFVALSRRWEWLVVPFALSLNEGVAPRPVVLGAAVAVVAIGSLARRLRSRRRPIEGVA